MKCCCCEEVKPLANGVLCEECHADEVASVVTGE